jgi:hypothetical protein
MAFSQGLAMPLDFPCGAPQAEQTATNRRVAPKEQEAGHSAGCMLSRTWCPSWVTRG